MASASADGGTQCPALDNLAIAITKRSYLSHPRAIPVGKCPSVQSEDNHGLPENLLPQQPDW